MIGVSNSKISIVSVDQLVKTLASHTGFAPAALKMQNERRRGSKSGFALLGERASELT